MDRHALISDFRLIPRIETFPKVVSYAQTTLGRITILAAFAFGLRYFLPDLLSATLFASLFALMTFMPKQRRLTLAVVPILGVVLANRGPLYAGLNLSVIALGIFLYWCAMRWPKSLFGQRPVVFLLIGFSVLVLFACTATQRSLRYSILWDLVGLTASYFWFIGYSLTDRSSKPAHDLTLELASYRPMWGSTNTPFPKGAAYLRRIEAQNPEQLAVAQLKGLKLLAWAILLASAQVWWMGFFHGYLRIPTSDQALTASVQGTPFPWHLCWESQILAFFEVILTFTIFGHRFIAACRMAGFNALRNTYRPLSSTTITEFFNRFYYYFKELLVDFFFYPTFLRYWKGHKRLRMIFAIFAAAFFGNSLYHLMKDWQIIRDDGLWRAFANYQVLFFYNAILATGLCISQLRGRGAKPTGFFRGRVLPVFGVGFFYCILNVFDADERMYPLVEHFKYLGGLFFIHF